MCCLQCLLGLRCHRTGQPENIRILCRLPFLSKSLVSCNIGVRFSQSAFGFGIHCADYLLHCLHAEKVAALPHRSVKGKAPCAGGAVLGQHQDLVEEVNRAVRLVGDDHHYFPLIRNRPKSLHKIPCHDAVQAGIRLIQNEQGRIGNVLHADGKALSLAAGELGNMRIGKLRKSEALQCLPHTDSLLRLRNVHGEPHLRGIQQRSRHRIVAAQKVRLRDKADAVLDTVVIFINIGAAQTDRGLCLFVAGNGIDEGGLTRAGPAQDQNHVPGTDVQRNVL